MKKKIIILTILTLTILTILLFQVKRKEVENSKQLKEETLKETVNLLKPKDSLFIVSMRTFGVCGNDERYNGFTSPIEKLKEIKSIVENPYFVNGSTEFEDGYIINNTNLIVGSAIDNEFNSTTQKFKYDDAKNEKQVYDIDFRTVNKDTVYVSLYDYFDKERKHTEFKMGQKNSKWQIETT